MVPPPRGNGLADALGPAPSSARARDSMHGGCVRKQWMLTAADISAFRPEGNGGRKGSHGIRPR